MYSFVLTNTMYMYSICKKYFLEYVSKRELHVCLLLLSKRNVRVNKQEKMPNCQDWDEDRNNFWREKHHARSEFTPYGCWNMVYQIKQKFYLAIWFKQFGGFSKFSYIVDSKNLCRFYF